MTTSSQTTKPARSNGDGGHTTTRRAAATQATSVKAVASPVVSVSQTTPLPAKKVPIDKSDFRLTEGDLHLINSRDGLIQLLRSNHVKWKPAVETLRYEAELRALQVELVRMQRWVQEKGKRIAILFEGRDAAGKGGAIRRFTEHLNPRAMRVVALPKPTPQERGQWYFQRYVRQLPNPGEIVFFDRSWYNRAVVEPVNSFCTEEEYKRFLQQVPEFEHMLYEDGVTLIKFWFSISKEEQFRRFESRRHNLLKQWKISPIDERAQDLWDAYTHYKLEMFSKTHTAFSPWIIVSANDKKKARVESIRHVLSSLPYKSRGELDVRLNPDPNIITRYHRASATLD
ncbi:MAG: polyphosphate kinase 2 [Verrucomicrobiaceae bacterium]|nr:polyphosphate kinase 2 [Verrucomicrobiaceae bacterium]